ALFDRYLQLVATEANLATDSSQVAEWSLDTLSNVIGERQNRRREYLGAEIADAFFGDEVRYENFQLELARIAADPMLSPSAKDAARADAELILSPEQREQRHSTFSYLDFKQRGANLNTADKMALASERFGDDAAERLKRYEAEQNDWA